MNSILEKFVKLGTKDDEVCQLYEVRAFKSINISGRRKMAFEDPEGDKRVYIKTDEEEIVKFYNLAKQLFLESEETIALVLFEVYTSDDFSLSVGYEQVLAVAYEGLAELPEAELTYVNAKLKDGWFDCMKAIALFRQQI